MASVTMVEMGETGLSRATEPRLQACGLGACLGLCLYDAGARIAILVHVVLPETPLPSSLAARRPTPPPGKCADTAVIHALGEIVRAGGSLAHVQAALAGGSQIFTGTGTDGGSLSRLEIGTRNVLAVKEELVRQGIPLEAEDTGGHFGRTVTLNPATGEVLIRPVGLGERRLALLGRSAAPAAPALERVYAYGA